MLADTCMSTLEYSLLVRVVRFTRPHSFYSTAQVLGDANRNGTAIVKSTNLFVAQTCVSWFNFIAAWEGREIYC